MLHLKFCYITENETTVQGIAEGYHSRVSSFKPDPLEGDSTEPCSISPPWILRSHHQHLADYAKLFMEEGEG